MLAGCDAASPPAAVAPVPQGKPHAAVELRLDAAVRSDGDYDLTLVATPTAATDALELTLDGERRRLGAVAAGEARTMTARLHVDAGRGREIVGAAAVGQGNHRRNRAATVWIGAPRVVTAPPVTIITMPDGSEIAEVRP